MAHPRASGRHRRRQWIVNPSLQYRFIGILLLVLVVLTIGALASVYLAIWLSLKTFGLADDPLALALLTTVGLMVTMELLLLAPLVVWIGVRLTHRVAGPMVRITASLAQMAQGDFDVHLTLRKGDALVEVAQAINVLAAACRSQFPHGSSPGLPPSSRFSSST